MQDPWYDPPLAEVTKVKDLDLQPLLFFDTTQAFHMENCGSLSKVVFMYNKTK